MNLNRGAHSRRTATIDFETPGQPLLGVASALEQLDGTLHSSENDDDSDFETEPLDTSSSDVDSDNDNRAGPSLGIAGTRRRRHSPSSTDDESEVSRDVPDWFQDKPFQYNGRVFLLAVPGFILVLLFSGDLFLTVIAIGSLIVYLLHHSGNRQKAIISYIAMFVIIQLTVVYSVLPLLWKSILNVVLILALNVYTFLTGGWIMLVFETLRLPESDLMMLIEASLFSLYPFVFVVLITWLVAVLTSVATAPYVFLLLGFVVLQVFLAPTSSSFIKPHAQGSLAVWDLPHGYILDVQTVAMITVIYTFIPPSLVILLKLTVSRIATILTFQSVVQTSFVGFSSVFLASFLHLRLFLDGHGIPTSYLVTVRWVAGGLALSIVSPFLQSFNIQCSVLIWLPAIVAICGVLMLAVLRRSKAFVCLSLGLLFFLGLVVFSQLPWHLDYFIRGGSGVVAQGSPGIMSVTTLVVLLFVIFLLCLLVVYASTYLSNDAFIISFILQSFCYLVGLRLMLVTSLVSFTHVVLSNGLHSYLVFRLYHVRKIDHQPSLLILAAHWAVTLMCIDAVYTDFSNSGYVVGLYNFIVTMLLVTVLIQLLVFEQQKSIGSHFVRYGVFLAIGLVLNLPILLSRVLFIFTGLASPPLSALVGVILVFVGVVYTKLVCFNISNDSVLSTLTYRCIVPSSILLPLSLIIIRPQLTLDSEELRKWLMVGGMLCASVIIPVATSSSSSSSSPSHSYLHIVGSVAVLPLAFTILYMVYPDQSVSLFVLAAVISLIILCILLILVVWLKPRHVASWIRNLVVMLLVNTILLYLIESVLSSFASTAIALVAGLAVMLLSAIVIHCHCISLHQDCLDPREETQSKSLALLGNICTLIGFFLLVGISLPYEFSYLMICAGSPMFLLLNIDNVLLAKLTADNRITAVAIATSLTLYLTVLRNNCLFLPDTGGHDSILPTIAGVIELLAVVCTLPVIFNLWTVCWTNNYWLSDRLVVFLAPVYFLFLFAGSTHASWCLTVYGLVSSYWLIKYRLPLEVDQDR